MAKKFLAAVAALTAGVFMGGAANAAYVNPVTNQIESSGSGDIIVTFVSLSAADSSDIYSLDFGGVLFNNQSSAIGTSVNIGSYGAGETIEFRLDNLSKTLSFFTGLASDNYDNVLHAMLMTNPDGSITVSFEDLPNGGDFDYNDFVFTVYETPIPAAALLMLTGLGGLGAAGRKRKAA